MIAMMGVDGGWWMESDRMQDGQGVEAGREEDEHSRLGMGKVVSGVVGATKAGLDRGKARADQ